MKISINLKINKNKATINDKSRNIVQILQRLPKYGSFFFWDNFRNNFANTNLNETQNISIQRKQTMNQCFEGKEEKRILHTSNLEQNKINAKNKKKS